jgi:serine/threonine-protein kinase
VAIKYLRRDLELTAEQRESLVQRLWQEARASARLSHPNIVALHDMGEDDELGPYLVFEHVEGPTLKERLRRGPLDARAAAQLARELGEALAAAHAGGVVHRDVKPENVILRRSGAKIADFGIARLPNSTLTRRGSLLGTPAYSAPETLRGARFSPLSDQFSLAATLYEATFGQRAFPGDDAILVANKVRLDDPPPRARANALDESVDRVLLRGLSKTPSQRFSDCGAFGAALAEALSQGADALELPPHPAQDTMSAVSVGATRARWNLGGLNFGVWNFRDWNFRGWQPSNWAAGLRSNLGPALVGTAVALLGVYYLLSPATARDLPSAEAGAAVPKLGAQPQARRSYVPAPVAPEEQSEPVAAKSVQPLASAAPKPARALDQHKADKAKPATSGASKRKTTGKALH